MTAFYVVDTPSKRQRRRCGTPQECSRRRPAICAKSSKTHTRAPSSPGAHFRYDFSSGFDDRIVQLFFFYRLFIILLSAAVVSKGRERKKKIRRGRVGRGVAACVRVEVPSTIVIQTRAAHVRNVYKRFIHEDKNDEPRIRRGQERRRLLAEARSAVITNDERVHCRLRVE